MIETGSTVAEGTLAPSMETVSPPPRRATSIVPGRSVAGSALVLVIAIMTFLSCLTLGAVTLVGDAAHTWQTQIAREATIQIKPADGLDMDAALETASRLAAGFAGVKSVRIVDRDATARLLEPWLGSGLDLEELPVPRLVIVTIDQDNPPDFAAMRTMLTSELPSASVDDHRTWVDRLVPMARPTGTICAAVLALMLAATVLSGVFPPRGAIAGEFRRHFLVTGVKGAAAGGFAAILVFAGFAWWSASNMATPEADQATALFGNFSIGATGYAGVALVVVAVAVLTAATSHVTVLRYLGTLDQRPVDH